MAPATCSELVETLGLQPHPEGGYFVESFRDTTVQLSREQLPETFAVGRPISTAIYFLIPSGRVSSLHRIPSAECWHFYGGDPLTVFELDDTGVKHTVLGPDILGGQKPQYVVRPGVWFGAYPTNDYVVGENGAPERQAESDPETHYSLVGCTVAPAFEFQDFELAKRDELMAKYPNAAGFVKLLTAATE